MIKFQQSYSNQTLLEMRFKGFSFSVSYLIFRAFILAQHGFEIDLPYGMLSHETNGYFYRHVMVMKMPCLDTMFTVMVMARSRYSQLNLSTLLSVTCCFKLMYVITSPSCRHLNALAKDDRSKNYRHIYNLAASP